MNNLNAKKDIDNMLQYALDNPEYTGTWFYPLGNYDRCRWAIVASYMNYGNGDKLYAKVASQPLNSIMQCDYDIDWEMPYDSIHGEVYDTEVCVGREESILADTRIIDWLLNEWEHIKANYIDEEVEK